MFRTKKDRLQKAYEQRKTELVEKSPDPVCVICKYCWYQAVCLRNVLNKHKPRTCCIYNLFYKNIVKVTLEDVVKYACGTKCVERQNWKGDPVPHTSYYCERYCPMSRYILNIKADDYENVPHNFGY